MKKDGFFRSNAFLAGAILTAVVCIYPPSAKALFGFGDIVFDPSTYATLGEIWKSNDGVLQKATESYTQIVALVQGVEQMHQFEQQMAVRFHQGFRHTLMTGVPSVIANYTKNQTGETAPWQEAVNGKPDLAQAAWKSATLPLSADASDQDLASAPGFERFLPDIATVEEQDGSSVQCLSTLAQYRKSTAENTAALQKFQDTVADESSETNSQIEQMNQINLGNSQALNEQRAQGQLKACEVQQQIIANSYQRNMIVDDLNLQAKVQAERKKGTGNIGNMSETLENYVP